MGPGCLDAATIEHEMFHALGIGRDFTISVELPHPTPYPRGGGVLCIHIIRVFLAFSDISEKERQLDSSVPAAPNWRISTFEKR